LVVWLLPESEQASEVSVPTRSAEVVIADAAEDVADESTATVAEPAGPAPSANVAAETSPRVERTVAAAPVAAPQPEADSEPDIEDVPASAVTVAPAIDSPSTEQPALNTPVGVRRITPTGSDRLLFQFTDDCWVEIKSATGASLYSDLSRAGRTLELVGIAPFRILLGYAPGVTMSFNDEAVALAPHTRNNVATLVLGQ
jgi:cytoskeleton protein RodZ